MMDQIQNTLKIDKSDWTPRTFGDVVFEPKETAKDILGEGIEHVVGLEHIDSENIHLRRSASIDESTTFTKKFAVGDVLFGRRRAYLKKAAQASFAGICSGDITVFRAKGELSPKLLPFIVQNENFFDYAIKHSAGGLSPRVKFKDLANYEFRLPPKAQQAELAELLWSMDEVIESELVVAANVRIIRDALYKKFRQNTNGWEKLKIKDLMTFNYGKALKETDRIEGEYPVVSSSGIQGTHNLYICDGPGIVVGRKGNVGDLTWVSKNFWAIDTAYFISINEQYSHIPLKFFYYLLKAANLKKHSIATAVPGLNRDDAILTSIYLPSEKDIDEYLHYFESIYDQIKKVDENIYASKSVQKSLINQVFS